MAVGLIVLIWLLSEAALLVRARSLPHESCDGGTLRLLAEMLMISLSAAYMFKWLGLTPLPGWLEFAGAAVVATGFVVRQYAIAVLGEFFTLNVAIRDQHPLVTAGPYRIVRHPGYSGVILICFGFGLSLCDAFALLASFIPITCALLARISREEQVLLSSIRGYREYSARTWRLCPYIW